MDAIIATTRRLPIEYVFAKWYFCSTQDVPAEHYILVFFHREMQITVFYYQVPNHDFNNQVNLLLNIRNGWWLDSYEAIH